MSVPVTLSFSGEQYQRLRRFLYPGDGCEAVAIVLCGARAGDRRHRLIARVIQEIPYEVCSVRTPSQVTWPTELLEPLLDQASDQGLSVVKVHSHPNGFPAFSDLDDASDGVLLPLIAESVESGALHGSAVMLPNGRIFGRILADDKSLVPLSAINVAGEDLLFWYPELGTAALPEFFASHSQAFGMGTTALLRRLSVAVVGCSGTGGPVVEQLFRLGVGELVLVDDDQMEERNVNRIPNSTMEDVYLQRYKVDVLAEAVRRTNLGTRVIAFKQNLWNRNVVEAVAQCDVVFGCMDTVDGRFLLNKLASYYTIPYIDLGVRLDAVPTGGEKGRIREVCGTVHYLQPGRSSLLSRGLFSIKQVAEAGLRRNDPKAHEQQVKDGYIKGANEQRPAVISVNMLAASLGVNELLARVHPYREERNDAYASTTFSLASMELLSESESERCGIFADSVGLADAEPMLGLLELSR